MALEKSSSHLLKSSPSAAECCLPKAAAALRLFGTVGDPVPEDAAAAAATVAAEERSGRLLGPPSLAEHEGTEEREQALRAPGEEGRRR